jgi:formylglycine-generating enzyme required for sulfatase activity
MISVDGGSFLWNKKIGEWGKTQKVKTTVKRFYLAETEVTVALWNAVMKDDPVNNLPLTHPVKRSWDDFQTFINRLNQLTGRKFRMPTDAEWEYAAKGGKYSKHYVYSGSNNASEVIGNGAVAQKAPNELGLYDMSGSVGEWVADKFGSLHQPDDLVSHAYYRRMIRGCVLDKSAKNCTVESWMSDNPENMSAGLRLAE